MFNNKKYISHIKKRMIILLDICLCLFIIISLSSCGAKQESTDPITDPEETEDIDTGKEEYLRAIELFDEGRFYSAKWLLKIALMMIMNNVLCNAYSLCQKQVNYGMTKI